MIIDHVMETVRGAPQILAHRDEKHHPTRESIASQVTVELGQLLDGEIIESYEPPRVYGPPGRPGGYWW